MLCALFNVSIVDFEQENARWELGKQKQLKIVGSNAKTVSEVCTSNRMVSSAINDKFDKWQLRGVTTFSSLSYHESNLSLIARETMRFLVNHQLVPIAIQSKSISLEQICYKRSQGIVVTSLNCLLFSA